MLQHQVDQDILPLGGLNTSSAQRSSGTTSTYVDEVPGEVMNIFDIDRIEVLMDLKVLSMDQMQLVEQ